MPQAEPVTPRAHASSPSSPPDSSPSSSSAPQNPRQQHNQLTPPPSASPSSPPPPFAERTSPSASPLLSARPDQSSLVEDLRQQVTSLQQQYHDTVFQSLFHSQSQGTQDGDLQKVQEELKEACEANKALTERVCALQQQLQAATPHPPSPPPFEGEVESAQQASGLLLLSKEQLMGEFLASAEVCRNKISSLLTLTDSVTRTLASSISTVSLAGHGHSGALQLLEEQVTSLVSKSDLLSNLHAQQANIADKSLPQLRSLLGIQSRLASFHEELSATHRQLEARIQTVGAGEQSLQRLQGWLAYLTTQPENPSLPASPGTFFHQNGELQAQLAKHVAALNDLGRDQRAHQERLRGEAAANDQLRAQLAQLDEAHKASESRNAHLLTQLEETSSRAEELSGRFGERERAVALLEEEKAAMTLQLKATQDKIDGLSDELQQVRASLSLRQSSLVTATMQTEQEGDALDLQLLALENQKALAVEEAQRISGELAQKDQEMASLIFELEEFQSNYRTLGESLREAEAEILDLQKMLTFREAEVFETQTKLEAQTKEIELSKTLLDDKTSECLELRELMGTKIGEMKQAHISLSHEHGTVLHENDSLHLRLQEQAKLVANLQEEQSTLRDTLQSQEAQHQLTTGELTAECQRLAASLTQEQALITSLKTELASLQAKLEAEKSAQAQSNSSLEQQLKTLQAELDSKIAGAGHLESQLGDLKQQLETKTLELTSQINEKAQTIQALKADVEALREESEARQALVEEKESTIFIMSATLQEKEDELHESATDCMIATKKVKELESQQSEMEKRLTSDSQEREKTASELADKLTAAQEEAQRLSEELATSGAKRNALSEELASVAASLENLRRDHTLALSSLEESRKSLQEAETERETLVQHIRITELALTTANETVVAEKSAQTSLEKRLADSQSSLQKATDQLVALEEDLKQKTASLEAIEQGHLEAVSNLESQLKEAKAYLGAAEGDKEALKARAVALEAQLTEKEEANALSLKRCMQLEVEASASGDKLKQETTRALEAESALGEARSHLSALQEEHTRQGDEAAQKLSALEEKNRSLSDENAKLSGELLLHKGSYEGSLLTLSSLREDLQRADQQIQDLRTSTHTTSSRLTAELGESKDLATRCQQDLAVATEKIAQQEAQLLDLQAANKALESREKAEIQARELQKQLQQLESRESARKKTEDKEAQERAAEKEKERVRAQEAERGREQAMERERQQAREKEQAIEREMELERQARELEEREKRRQQEEEEKLAERRSRRKKDPEELQSSQVAKQDFPDETLSQSQRKRKGKFPLQSPGKKMKESPPEQESPKVESPKPETRKAIPKSPEHPPPPPETLTQEAKRKRKLVEAAVSPPPTVPVSAPSTTSESAETLSPPHAGSPSSATRSKKKKGPVVVAFSGFKHNHPEFNLEVRQTLEQVVIKLGGKVKNESEFDGNITHVVSPPNSRTVKTLAAVLTHKWLVNTKWILDSLEAGGFIDEDLYGIHSNDSPFRGKKFFLTDQFVKEQEKKESKLQNCKSLIVLFGKGEMVKDLTKADMVVRSSSESIHSFTCPSVDWESFIDLIAGGGKLRS